MTNENTFCDPAWKITDAPLSLQYDSPNVTTVDIFTVRFAVRVNVNRGNMGVEALKSHMTGNENLKEIVLMEKNRAFFLKSQKT